MLVERISVHERVSGAEEALPQVGVTGDDARLRQRLELPDLTPLLPVRLVAFDRAREHPLLSLGTQARIDSERLALRSGLADRAHEMGRGPLRLLERGRA